MRRIFFGTLRAAELEHLIEKAWYAVTETCLTFTLIRDDLNAKFVALFAVLLFLKCFHWLVEDRVDFMERSPNIVILFHIRIVSLLLVLASSDLAFIYYSHTGASKDSSYQLIFGFEYAILLANILNIVIKYTLHWIDIACDSQWDEKAACLLFLELLMSLIKIILYSAFFIQMLRYYSFPLFVLRPIYLCIRTFRKAVSDVIMSRRAISNMNTLYPTVTQEELSNTDNVCIICREEMNADSGIAKKLPCNHIFHVSCLRSWFQRQQTCPTCRMDILRTVRPTLVPGAQGGPGGMGPRPRMEDFANNHGGVQAGQQAGAVTQDQMVAVMAQMFVQAMLTHLQALQQNQSQQQQQQLQNQQEQREQQLQQLQQQQEQHEQQFQQLERQFQLQLDQLQRQLQEQQQQLAQRSQHATTTTTTPASSTPTTTTTTTSTNEPTQEQQQQQQEVNEQ